MYLNEARKRLDAIRRIADGNSTEHMYRVTPLGKVCMGCGLMKQGAPKVCSGSVYAADPMPVIKLRTTALGVLILEAEILLARLAEAHADFVALMGKAGKMAAIELEKDAAHALEKIQKPAE